MFVDLREHFINTDIISKYYEEHNIILGIIYNIMKHKTSIIPIKSSGMTQLLS